MRLKVKVSKPQLLSFAGQAARSDLIEKSEYQSGQTVAHHQFGEGVVLQCEGIGEHARVQVRFANAVGTKWLLASFLQGR